MNKKQAKTILVTFLIFFACDKSTSDHKVAIAKDEIQIIMNQQKEAWNSGSIEGFMHYYWKSDEFRFQSGDRRLYGWSELLEMYQKNYSGENMGRLDFTDIEINVLTGQIAYVLGRWKVTTEESSKQGLFTLIFKKFNSEWRIIVDHSS